MNKRYPSPKLIREQRLKSKLSQQRAATLIYCSLSTWQQWESGINRMHPAFWELFQIKLKQRCDEILKILQLLK